MKTIQKAKWCYIICSILFCLFGLCLIIWPTISAKTLCYVLGGIAILYSLTKIIGYFTRDIYRLAFQFDLALGIFFAVLGLLLLLQPSYILALLPVIIGLLIFVDGIFKVQTAIDAKRFGLTKWWGILLGAVLCIALGIFLIFSPLEGGKVLMILIGVSLLVDGLQNLFNAIYTVKILNHAKTVDSEEY